MKTDNMGLLGLRVIDEDVVAELGRELKERNRDNLIAMAILKRMELELQSVMRRLESAELKISTVYNSILRGTHEDNFSNGAHRHHAKQNSNHRNKRRTTRC